MSVTCEVCGKSFKSQNALFAHSRIHRKNAPQRVPTRCQTCGRTFSSAQGLTVHLARAHPKLPLNDASMVPFYAELPSGEVLLGLRRGRRVVYFKGTRVEL